MVAIPTQATAGSASPISNHAANSVIIGATPRISG